MEGYSLGLLLGVSLGNTDELGRPDKLGETDGAAQPGNDNIAVNDRKVSTNSRFMVVKAGSSTIITSPLRIPFSNSALFRSEEMKSPKTNVLTKFELSHGLFESLVSADNDPPLNSSIL